MLPGRFGRRPAAVLLCVFAAGPFEYVFGILSGISFFLTDIPEFYMLKESKIIYPYL